MYQYIAWCICLLSFSSAFAQQDPVFSLSQEQMAVFNPAMAGIKDYVEIQALARTQWVNAPESPNAQIITVGIPMGRNMGLGLNISNENTFVQKNTSIGIDYNYQIRLNSAYKLTIGLKGLGSSFSVNRRDLKVFDTREDASLGNLSRFNWNVGTGATLVGSNLLVGVAIPRLLNTNRLDEQNSIGGLQQVQHIYLYGRYTYEVSESFRIKPGILARVVEGLPTTFDISTFAAYNKIEAGLTWRTTNALSTSVLFQLSDKFKVGYTHEFQTGNQINFGGSHEFYISYQIENLRNAAQNYHLRYVE